MKMPDKIKKGLECCVEGGSCNACTYDIGCAKCIADLLADASAYIQQLECECDAAVMDLEACCPCEVCTRSCKYDKVNAYSECSDFEWRGVQEDSHGAE